MEQTDRQTFGLQHRLMRLSKVGRGQYPNVFRNRIEKVDFSSLSRL